MISKVGFSLKILIFGPHHQLNNCSKNLDWSKDLLHKVRQSFLQPKKSQVRFVFRVGVSGKPNVQRTCVSPQANTTLVQCGFTSVVFLPSISTRYQDRYWIKWTWWEKKLSSSTMVSNTFGRQKYIFQWMGKRRQKRNNRSAHLATFSNWYLATCCEYVSDALCYVH